MGRTLDILVPCYNESVKVIAPLLDSIKLQQGVDLENEIGVIVCCDGGSLALTSDFMKEYPFYMEFHACDHKGVSATRNSCLDYSTADYVMFCDIDDMFYNMCGLWIVFREINEMGGFNTLVSAFVEETHEPDSSKFTYVKHDMDSTFVHGKVHKRQYLIDENIRWNESLTVHEDSYFNCLCQKLAGEQGAKYCPTPFYLWKWRDDSVCRHDKKYILKTYNNMLDSNTALVNEFISRDKIDDAKFYISGMVFDAYYTLNKDEWVNQENQDYRHATELRFKQYWHDFKPMFSSLTKEQKTMVASGIRQRMFAEGLLNEVVTFDQFIKNIESLED